MFVPEPPKFRIGEVWITRNRQRALIYQINHFDMLAVVNNEEIKLRRNGTGGLNIFDLMEKSADQSMHEFPEEYIRAVMQEPYPVCKVHLMAKKR